MIMRGWKVALDQDAVESLLSYRPTDRRALIRFFDALKSNPLLPGDYEEFDDVGRTIQAKKHNRFLLRYWADHAAKELRILIGSYRVASLRPELILSTSACCAIL